jgi:hypothetical protein
VVVWEGGWVPGMPSYVGEDVVNVKLENDIESSKHAVASANSDPRVRESTARAPA